MTTNGGNGHNGNGHNGHNGANGSSKTPVVATSAVERIRAEIRRLSAVNSESPSIPKVSHGTDRLKSIDGLPEDVDERTRVYIVQGRDPRGEIDGPDNLILTVCRKLLLAGVKDELLYGILVDDRYEISKHVLAKDDVERYVLRQIQRAHDSKKFKDLLMLNDAHAVISNYGGRCRVLEEPVSEEDRLVLQSFDDFKNRYNNRKVLAGYDQKGNPLEKPLGTWWLDQPARRQYRTITFAPG